MAKERTSFLLHFDSLEILNELSDEEAGQLFKAIKAHHEEKELTLSPLVRVAFASFKNQFVRDEKKYQETCKRRAEAGSKGGVAKASKAKQKVAKDSNTKQTVANLADSDSKKNKNSDSKSDSNTSSSVPAKPKPVKYQPDDLNFAESFYNRLLVMNPDYKKPDFDKWADAVRLCREQDGRDLLQLWKVFDWASNDEFWSTNILSPSTLRKQYDKLVIKMNQPEKTYTSYGRQPAPSASIDTDWNNNMDETF